MKKFIQLEKEDNVVVAVTPFQKGDILHLGEIQIKVINEVPSGHKLSIKNIRRKEPVIKYGLSVGVALVDIIPGEHVHIHNTSSE